MLNHYQHETSPSNHLSDLNWKSPAASQVRVLPPWGTGGGGGVGGPLGRPPPPSPYSHPCCPFTPGQDRPGPWKPSQGSHPTRGPPQLRHPPRGELPETATARVAARMDWSPPWRVAALGQRPPPPARLTDLRDPLLSGHCFVGILSQYQSSGGRRPPRTGRGARPGSRTVTRALATRRAPLS